MGRQLKHREREMFRELGRSGVLGPNPAWRNLEDQRLSKSFFVLMVMLMRSERGKVTCRWSIPSLMDAE